MIERAPLRRAACGLFIGFALLSAPGCALPPVATPAERRASLSAIEQFHIDDGAGGVSCLLDRVQSLSTPLFATSTNYTEIFRQEILAELSRVQGCCTPTAGIGRLSPLQISSVPHLPTTQTLAPHQKVPILVEGQELTLSDGTTFSLVPFETYVGCAVPLTADGYFLTAAHVVEDNHDLTIACLDVDHTIQIVPARVVWIRGRKTAGTDKDRIMDDVSDVAIIHSDVRPAVTSNLLGGDEAAFKALVGRDIVGGRYLVSEDSYESFPYYAGRLLWVGSSVSDSDVIAFVAAAPCRMGDSGGPFLLDSGEVLGILSGESHTYFHRYAVAWTIKPDRIAGIIAADRAARTGSSLPPASTQLPSDAPAP